MRPWRPSFDLGLELVDEVDDVEEAGLPAGSDAAAGDGYGDMALARAGAADEDDVALAVEEARRRRDRAQACSLIGVPSKAMSASSLASGSLALPIW